MSTNKNYCTEWDMSSMLKKILNHRKCSKKNTTTKQKSNQHQHFEVTLTGINVLLLH